MSVIALISIRKSHQNVLKRPFSRRGHQSALISWVEKAWQLGEESRHSKALKGLLHESRGFRVIEPVTPKIAISLGEPPPLLPAY
jgi:hypothetical protein